MKLACAALGKLAGTTPGNLCDEDLEARLLGLLEGGPDGVKGRSNAVAVWVFHLCAEVLVEGRLSGGSRSLAALSDRLCDTVREMKLACVALGELAGTSSGPAYDTRWEFDLLDLLEGGPDGVGRRTSAVKEWVAQVGAEGIARRRIAELVEDFGKGPARADEIRHLLYQAADGYR